MKRLNSLQIGRALAVVGVFLFHLSGLSVEYLHGMFYLPWTQVLRAGVDVFFVISGVVMVATSYSKLGQPGTAKRFLIHRVSRIYPPYLCMTAILTAYWAFRPSAVDSHGVDLFSSYTLWPSDKLPLVPVGWTLSFEMMFYVVFFFIISAVRKERLPHALGIWVVAVIAGRTMVALDSFGAILSAFPQATFFFSPYVLEFISGCFIGLASLKHEMSFPRSSVVAALAIFALEAVRFQAVNFNGDRKPILHVLFFGLPSALLVYGLVGWERQPDWFAPPRWAIRCGDISYSIYLVHLPILHFAYRYVWEIFKPVPLRPVFLILTTALAFAASVVYFSIVEKPFSSWTRMWLEKLFGVPAKVAGIPNSADRASDAA